MGRRISKYSGVYQIRSGSRKGSFKATFKLGERYHTAGTWLEERSAALAHDRLVLFLQASRRLNFPKRAKKLGPASDVELARLARLEYRRALGRSPLEGVSNKLTGFRAGAFMATLTHNGKTTSVGTWPTQREAAIARDRALLGIGVHDVPLHFPREAKKLGGATVAELRRLARLRHQELTESSSLYWGVRWETERRAWVAQTFVDNKLKHIGYFHDEKRAALLRDRVEKWRSGKKARLNFPKEAGGPLSLEQARRVARQEFKGRTSSRHDGVYLMAPDGALPWAATLTMRVRGRRTTIFLGKWHSETEAARAHDRAALFYLGESPQRVRLNFPEQRSELEATDAASLVAEARAIFKAQTSSRFRGVTLFRRDNVWIAMFKYQGKVFRSRHRDEEAAARWYDARAIRHLGDSACLNFHPTTGEELCGKRLGGPLVAHGSKQGAGLRKARRQRIARGRKA